MKIEGVCHPVISVCPFNLAEFYANNAHTSPHFADTSVWIRILPNRKYICPQMSRYFPTIDDLCYLQKIASTEETSRTCFARQMFGIIRKWGSWGQARLGSTLFQGFRQDLGNWVCKRKTWVCKILDRYSRNSFIQMFASLNIGLLLCRRLQTTFVAQMFKKPKQLQKNLKKKKKIYIFFLHFFSGRVKLFKSGGQHGWLPKPLPYLSGRVSQSSELSQLMTHCWTGLLLYLFTQLVNILKSPLMAIWFICW